jgi:Mitochondrial degradasome RNA helicase subunit C terminal
VCDVYLWLSFKFPREFYQSKDVINLRDVILRETTTLLDGSLLTQKPKTDGKGTAAWREPQKRRKGTVKLSSITR